LGKLAGRPIYHRPDTQDEIVYDEVVIENEYELPERFEATDTIIDVGAHIGIFALACFGRGAGRVISFEPDPDNCKVLRINHPHLEHCYSMPVWGNNEPIEFLPNCVHPHYTAIPRMYRAGWRGERWQAIPIDQILHDFSPVRLLKLDCEGAEFSIFRHGTLFRNCQTIVGELHHMYTHESEEMVRGLSKLRQMGFKIRWRANVHASEMLSHFWAERLY
jgi:FkbM family methyltransferase